MEYPVIDLHGLDKVSALISINEFINDNIKLRNYNILIIHGKGSGILKMLLMNIYLKIKE